MTDIRIDIRNCLAVADAISSIQPDVVFHSAAQALVRRSYEDPVETWQTNVPGTLDVLEALRKIDKLCAAVIITTILSGYAGIGRPIHWGARSIQCFKRDC